MISVRRLIMILLLAAIILLPTGSGLKVSVSSDAGSISEEIAAGDDGAIKSGTVIATNGLSHSMEGSGCLKESHSVSNTAGAHAEVGANIRNAEWYAYSYDLWPGRGSSWPASGFGQVAASEELDVLNAEYIQAYARALNRKGYTADVNTVIYDPGTMASLSEYRNLAMASKNEAMASQTADGAWAPNGYIQADSQADFTQLKSHPLQFREDEAKQSARIDYGSVQGYTDLASASAYGIRAAQQTEAATGGQIQTKSQSASWTASLFRGLKKTADAKVSTSVEGSLSGYDASAYSSKDQAEAEQTGHVVGSFSSMAIAGMASNARSSNYGNEYDFEMQARKDATGPYASGNVGYYVDNSSPVANRIQGAVDAAESGDSINVAAGTYRENVDIQKSLVVRGAGASETIVDGQQAGSVFIIGSQGNPELDVALSGMTMQNGSGTYTERWPGEPLVQCGGGIWNWGNLSLQDSIVFQNTANRYGSGIWNTGALNVDGSIIYGNSKALDGGGIWSSGKLILRNSTVAGNAAYWNGGGIWNSGEVFVGRSNVSGNSAGYYGGGIANDMGYAKVIDNTISGNTASLGGGGVYTILGKVLLVDDAISANIGNDGGGILNNGEMAVIGGSISNNNAVNGGGILSLGAMDIIDGSVDHNRAHNGSVTNYGMMNIYGGSIDHNAADYEGGGVRNLGELNLYGGTISDNLAAVGGGICNVFGTVNLWGGSVHNNTADVGGGVDNYQGTLNLYGGFISDNTASGGGGVSNFGVMNMYGGSIDHNIASGVGEGGGIYNIGGTVNQYDGSISNNIADYVGAGIYSDYYGTVNLYGGSVDHNTADYRGGGIYSTYYSTVNMEGGSISNNNASFGGGIYNENQGIVNLYNGSISNNTAGHEGAGIYNIFDSTTNLYGGSIDHNTADHEGGGIYSYFSTVNMEGGSISNNNASFGGGIYNGGNYYDYHGTVNLNSGSIDHNTAKYVGGGIYNEGAINGNKSLVQDNSPDDIWPWLPEP